MQPTLRYILNPNLINEQKGNSIDISQTSPYCLNFIADGFFNTAGHNDPYSFAHYDCDDGSWQLHKAVRCHTPAGEPDSSLTLQPRPTTRRHELDTLLPPGHQLLIRRPKRRLSTTKQLLLLPRYHSIFLPSRYSKRSIPMWGCIQWKPCRSTRRESTLPLERNYLPWMANITAYDTSTVNWASSWIHLDLSRLLPEYS